MCIVQMIPGMGASKIIGNGFLSVHSGVTHVGPGAPMTCNLCYRIVTKRHTANVYISARLMAYTCRANTNEVGLQND